MDQALCRTDYRRPGRYEIIEQLTSKPFVLIEKKEQANGDIQLRYGESKDDPVPFIITVTLAYVAHKTGKSPVNSEEVLHHVESQSLVLSLISVHQQNRGYSTFNNSSVVMYRRWCRRLW